MGISSDYMEEVFEFKGQWDVPSHCGLKVIKKEEQVIVITTELYETNPGTSVTRWTAQLANYICDLKNIELEKLVFIVHIPDRKSKLDFYKETFDRVEFCIENGQLIEPVWNRILREEVDRLLK
ncbi:MAG: hypothetical protein R2764_21745 [Bacteroidales bacterium]